MPPMDEPTASTLGAGGWLWTTGRHVTPPCCPGRPATVGLQIPDSPTRRSGGTGGGERGVGLVASRPRPAAAPPRWYRPGLEAARPPRRRPSRPPAVGGGGERARAPAPWAPPAAGAGADLWRACPAGRSPRSRGRALPSAPHLAPWPLWPVRLRAQGLTALRPLTPPAAFRLLCPSPSPQRPWSCPPASLVRVERDVRTSPTPTARRFSPTQIPSTKSLTSRTACS